MKMRTAESFIITYCMHDHLNCPSQSPVTMTHLTHLHVHSHSVYVSANNLFRELELWDEVVTCYQLLDKPHRAELVVRERLSQPNGTTPYMLTALGDLTNDEDCYERAWNLSKGRYARAKRTLAQMCFNRGDWERCVGHLDQALAIHPLVPRSWYLKVSRRDSTTSFIFVSNGCCAELVGIA